MSNPRKPKPFLVYFLAFVATLFIGFLVFIYAASERAKPVLLDEHGKPVAGAHAHHG